MTKFSNLFRKPSSLQLAQAELEEARRELLIAQTGRDYAMSMVDYHNTRIQRLEAMLREKSGGAV